MSRIGERAKQGPCFKCEKPTKSHHDFLLVYTTEGSFYRNIHICHECWQNLEEGELTEYKKQLLIRIKAEVQERAKALAAVQAGQDEAVRDEQDQSGENLQPSLWS